MADLVASLIGIIGAGTKVAMVLSQVASEIGSAGKEAQIMAREIRSFCTIIRVLSQTMDSIYSDMNWGQYSHCSEVISDMTVVSKEMFIEILGLIDSIQKASWGGPISSSSPKFNLASRIRWVMNKPKFAFLRSALEAYKSNLSLLLGSIQLTQSLGPRSNSSSSGSAEDVSQGPSYSRASLALSIDLQDIANDYQTSMQEMEAARVDADNAPPSESPPWECLPGDEDQADATTIEAPQDSQLQELITIARDEVRSLRSASGIYSGSTASIYSSLSRNSRRLSLMVDELPMVEGLDGSERRKSISLSIRTTRIAASSSLVPVPETQVLRASEPQGKWAEYESEKEIDADWAFRELQSKYKNVKRLYFDGIAQLNELKEQVSAFQTAAPEPAVKSLRRKAPDNEDWGRWLERQGLNSPN